MVSEVEDEDEYWIGQEADIRSTRQRAIELKLKKAQAEIWLLRKRGPA